MRIGVTPRFEMSHHGDHWYSFERSILTGLSKAFENSSLLLLAPEIHTEFENLDLLIFSGGETPGVNRRRDVFEEELFHKAAQQSVPMIGICRGAQLFAFLTGGSLMEIEGHIDAVRKTGKKPYGRCFHRWAINTIADNWEIVARDFQDNSIELFRHTRQQILGVMAHPERLQESPELFRELFEMTVK